MLQLAMSVDQTPSPEAVIRLPYHPARPKPPPLINRKLPVEILYYIFELLQSTSPVTLNTARLVHSTWNFIILPLAYQSITLTPTLLTPSLRAKLPNPALVFRSIYLHTRHVRIQGSTATSTAPTFDERREITTILSKCRSLEAVTYAYPSDDYYHEGEDEEEEEEDTFDDTDIDMSDDVVEDVDVDLVDVDVDVEVDLVVPDSGWIPSDLRDIVIDDDNYYDNDDGYHHKRTAAAATTRISLFVENYRLGQNLAESIPTEMLVSLHVIAERNPWGRVELKDRTELRRLVERCPRLRVLRYGDEEVRAVVEFFFSAAAAAAAAENQHESWLKDEVVVEVEKEEEEEEEEEAVKSITGGCRRWEGRQSMMSAGGDGRHHWNVSRVVRFEMLEGWRARRRMKRSICRKEQPRKVKQRREVNLKRLELLLGRVGGGNAVID